MTPAGRRDRKIAFLRATKTRDDHNEPLLTWAPVGAAWAAIWFGRGEERRQAAREAGGQAATFNVLANAMTRGVTVEDRIGAEGGEWDITGISPMNRAEIEFTARRVL